MAELTAGDQSALSTLTDSARQHDIDACILAINQTIDEMYSTIDEARPQQQASSTITLVTGQRNYTLATNFVRLHFPLIDQTNTQYINQFGGTYDDLLELDPEVDDTGVPMWAVIRPTDSALYVYPTPTSVENGNVYTYQYDSDTELTAAASTVPFNNFVYRAFLPAAFQLWKRERRGEFDAALFKDHLGRALRRLGQVGADDNYNPRC
jgi:hypothetical protein